MNDLNTFFFDHWLFFLLMVGIIKEVKCELVQSHPEICVQRKNNNNKLRWILFLN